MLPEGYNDYTMACVYAVLILHEEKIPINADNINSLVNTAGVKVPSYWTTLFVKSLQGKDISELAYSVVFQRHDQHKNLSYKQRVETNEYTEYANSNKFTSKLTAGGIQAHYKALGKASPFAHALTNILRVTEGFLGTYCCVDQNGATIEVRFELGAKFDEIRIILTQKQREILETFPITIETVYFKNVRQFVLTNVEPRGSNVSIEPKLSEDNDGYDIFTAGHIITKCRDNNDDFDAQPFFACTNNEDYPTHFSEAIHYQAYYHNNDRDIGWIRIPKTEKLKDLDANEKIASHSDAFLATLHKNQYPIHFDTRKPYGETIIIKAKCLKSSGMPVEDRIIVTIAGVDPFNEGDSGMLVYCLDAYNVKFLLGIYEGIMDDEESRKDRTKSYHVVTKIHKLSWFKKFGVNFPEQEPVVFHPQKKDTSHDDVITVWPEIEKDEEAEVGTLESLSIEDVGEELVVNTSTWKPEDTTDEEAEVETLLSEEMPEK